MITSMKMRVVYLPIAWLGIWGVTIYPFIIIDSGRTPAQALVILPHEMSHWCDEDAWFRRGWFPGVVAWFLVYLFCLPFIWNPLRRATETRAFRVQGFNLDTINAFLRRWPYKLYF